MEGRLWRVNGPLDGGWLLRGGGRKEGRQAGRKADRTTATAADRHCTVSGEEWRALISLSWHSA